jgi:hypothetical protein
VMLTALALVPAGAHLFALPNKIGLDSARYFTVQASTAAGRCSALSFLGALVANLALPLLPRRRPVHFALASPSLGRFSAHRRDAHDLLNLILGAGHCCPK